MQFTVNNTIFVPNVLSYTDYYPFGMLVPNRHGNTNSYRYGFQNQEKDDEIKGEGNSINYKFRMHDPRVGRFFAKDPLDWEFPYFSPYQFSGNRVIDAIELEGLENLVLTQYEWKEYGGTVKLSYGIVKTDGNWEGNRYRTAYFLKNDKSESGFNYYNESGDDRNGSAWLAMKNDNPFYFQALLMYHNFQAQKQKRIAGDAAMIVGGLITTIVSFGTGTPAYLAAIGGTTGIFQMGVGSGKLIADFQGNFQASDELPNSVFGGFGQAMDDAFSDGKNKTYENIGDIASTLILLAGPKTDWTAWGTLKPIDKAYSSLNLIILYDGIYGKNLSDEMKEKYGKDLQKILDEYSKILKAVEEK